MAGTKAERILELRAERAPQAPATVEPFLSSPQNLAALPVVVNLDLYAGDDFSFQLYVRDAGGYPANLSGATVRSQIRQTAQTPSIAGTFTATVSGSSVLLDLTGTVSGRLPAQCVWDCELTQAGRVTTLAAGRITMTPEVTR